MQESHIEEILIDENYQELLRIFGKEEIRTFLRKTRLTKVQVKALVEDNMGVIALYATRLVEILGEKNAATAFKKLTLGKTKETEFQKYLQTVTNAETRLALQNLRDIVLNNTIEITKEYTLDDGQIALSKTKRSAINQVAAADGEQTKKCEINAKGEIVFVPSGCLTPAAIAEVQLITRTYLNAYAEKLIAPTPTNIPLQNSDTHDNDVTTTETNTTVNTVAAPCPTPVVTQAPSHTEAEEDIIFYQNRARQIAADAKLAAYLQAQEISLFLTKALFKQQLIEMAATLAVMGKILQDMRQVTEAVTAYSQHGFLGRQNSNNTNTNTHTTDDQNNQRFVYLLPTLVQ